MIRERITNRLPLVALGVAVVWSLFLYLPWAQNYLDRADFNEFLPLLKRGRSFLESFRLVSDYYWAEGRFIPLTVAYTAAKWSAFGTWARGWQFATQALMLANVVLTYKVARRLGASKAGSCVGSVLMIVGASAVEAWSRVHLSEAEGTLFSLAAAYFAADFRRDPARNRAWAALPLLVCAILTKETFVAVAPFVVLVGLTYQGDRTWTIPQLGARELKWALLVMTSAAVAITPALIARLTSGPSSYSAQYGSLHFAPTPFGAQVQTRFFSVANPFQEPLADILLLGVIVAGWIVGIRRRIAGTGWVVGVAVLLSLPLAGAIVYLPWPTWAFFYGLPFALGMSVLLALACTFLIESPYAYLRTVSAAALTGAIVLMTAWAKHQSADIYARRQVVGATIDALSAEMRTRMPVQILVPERYRGEAQTFARYAGATHEIRFPPIHGVNCASLQSPGNSTQTSLLIDFSYLCPDTPSVTGTKIYETSVTYRWLDFGEQPLRSSRYSGALFRVSVPLVR